jgi:hypothetical protein
VEQVEQLEQQRQLVEEKMIRLRHIVREASDWNDELPRIAQQSAFSRGNGRKKLV